MTAARIWFAISAVTFTFFVLLLWALLQAGKPVGVSLLLLLWLGHLVASACMLDRHARGDDCSLHIPAALRALDRVQAGRRSGAAK